MSEAKPTDNERAYCHGRPTGSQGHEAVPGISQLHAHCRFCNRRITNVLGVWMLAKGEKIMPEPPKAKYVMLDLAGKVTTCDRCGDPCRVADRRNPDSKPFRLSEKPKGVCANCVMTQFLYNTYPVNLQIDEAGPELLLKPGIREAFLSCGLLDGCDLNIEREFGLNAGDRPDFFLQSKRLGNLIVEVKVNDALAKVTRQIHRYAQHESVDAILLVTSRHTHRDIPQEINGKPVRVLLLGSFGL